MKWLGPLVALLAITASVFYLMEARKQYESSPANQTHFPPALRAALSQARNEHKNVVVMFTAEWCGACRYMHNQVLPNAAVRAQAGRFVWVYLDVDGPGNEAVAREFGVRSLPTFFVLNENGRELNNFSVCNVEACAGMLARY